MFSHTQILKPPAARVAEVVTRSSLASQCQQRDALLDGFACGNKEFRSKFMWN